MNHWKTIRVLAIALFAAGCTFDEQSDVELTADSATAFRLSGLTLLDPHAYVSAGSCRDVTASAPGGAQGVNQVMWSRLNSANGGQLAHSSMVAILSNLDPAAEQSHVTLASAKCSAQENGRGCSLEAGGLQATVTATHSQEACLPILPRTLRPYPEAPQPTAGPCFEAGPFEIPIHYFLGLKGTITDAYIAAQFDNGQLKGGQVRGFLSWDEASKESMFLHRRVGWKTVGDLLPAGQNSCPPGNDLDRGPNDITGWYLYLDLTTEKVSIAP